VSRGRVSHRRRLFDEPVEAWDNGPVVNRIYARYADIPYQVIAKHRLVAKPQLPSSVAQFLNQIWDIYHQYTASKLVAMTHSEPPWRDNHRPGARHVAIPDADMLQWFHTGTPIDQIVLCDDVVLLTDDDLAALDARSDQDILRMWRNCTCRIID